MISFAKDSRGIYGKVIFIELNVRRIGANMHANKRRDSPGGVRSECGVGTAVLDATRKANIKES